MRNYLLLSLALIVVSCTEITDTPLNPSETKPKYKITEIYAEKDSWNSVTRSSDDNMYLNDVPWENGEKVMLIRTDIADSIVNATIEEVKEKYPEIDVESVEFDNIVYSIVTRIIDIDDMIQTHMCVVSESDGLKCTLVPDEPMEEGVYQAVYPVYDYVFYSHLDRSLMIHFSFLYDKYGLEYEHQDIVISDKLSCKREEEMSFVMRHVCALIDIDIYPPKTGNYTLLKVIANNAVFAGKANYYMNNEFDVDSIADGWLNYTTLRGKSMYMTEGEQFHTSTGLLPIQYNDMPMNIYIAYDDGTYYLSEQFLMPSLDFGVENKLSISNFTKLDGPMVGFHGEKYMDSDSFFSETLYWDMEKTLH